MESFIQFMARRELISNKIEEFDNTPVNYNTWKAAFMNMIRELKISPSEKLALMIEYITSESKRLIQRLRNAYLVKPTAGVKESWKKLGERFGSTAVITQVHLNKLTMVPSLIAKGNKGLLELGDLLLELQCAKEDGGLSGLEILDEAAFLRPLIAKLPGDLQGRWQRYAYRYKTQHMVNYPPLNEFASFVQEVARERNEPYLMIETSEKRSNAVKSYTKPPTKSQAYRIFSFHTSPGSLKDWGLRANIQWCVIHKLSQPLGKCHVFRAMPLTERKNLLNQHRVCFCCVASNSHQVKDCTMVVKCIECQSDKHVAVLHIGPFNEPEPNVKEPARLETPISKAGRHPTLQSAVQKFVEIQPAEGHARRSAQPLFT